MGEDKTQTAEPKSATIATFRYETEVAMLTDGVEVMLWRRVRMADGRADFKQLLDKRFAPADGFAAISHAIEQDMLTQLGDKDENGH